MATDQPALASSRTTPRPRPREPPVTRATGSVGMGTPEGLFARVDLGRMVSPDSPGQPIVYYIFYPSPRTIFFPREGLLTREDPGNLPACHKSEYL